MPGFRNQLSVFLLLAFSAGIVHAETVERAMADAYLGNPTLAGARAQWHAALEQVDVARAAKRPTLQASASYGRLHDKLWSYYTPQLPNYYSEFHYTPRTTNVNATLPLFRGGALDATERVAEAQAAVQRAQLAGTEQLILAAVGRVCADLIRAEAGLALAKEYQKGLQEAADDAARRLKLQYATVTDRSQAESRLAHARAQTSQAVAQLATARITFETLVGRPADGTPAPLSFSIPAHSEEEASMLARSDNPTLLAARQGLGAAEAGTDVAWGNSLPSLDLVASYATAKEGSAATLQERTSDLKATLSYPLYAGGSYASRQRQAAELASVSRFQLQDNDTAVATQVRQTWRNLLASEKVLGARQGHADAAARSLEGVRFQFLRGTRTFLDTLNALQESITARTNLLDAKHALILAKLDLLTAMGQLTATYLKLPPPQVGAEGASMTGRNGR